MTTSKSDGGVGGAKLLTKSVELNCVWKHRVADGELALFYRYDHKTAEAWWVLSYPHGVVSMHPDGEYKHSYDGLHSTIWKRLVEGS